MSPSGCRAGSPLTKSVNEHCRAGQLLPARARVGQRPLAQDGQLGGRLGRPGRLAFLGGRGGSQHDGGKARAGTNRRLRRGHAQVIYSGSWGWGRREQL